MKTRIAMLIAAAILAVLLSDWARNIKQVKASDDCPVISSTPDGKGGASVVFNCGSKMLTIQEPVWP